MSAFYFMEQRVESLLILDFLFASFFLASELTFFSFPVFLNFLILLGGVSIRQGKFHFGRASGWRRNNPRMQSLK